MIFNHSIGIARCLLAHYILFLSSPLKCNYSTNQIKAYPTFIDEMHSPLFNFSVRLAAGTLKNWNRIHGLVGCFIKYKIVPDFG